MGNMFENLYQHLDGTPEGYLAWTEILQQFNDLLLTVDELEPLADDHEQARAEAERGQAA